MGNGRGEVEAVTDFLFLGSKIAVDGDCRLEIRICLLLERKVMTNLERVLKISDTTLLTKFHPSSQSYGFSRSHVGMWELNHKKGWALKNWCFWTVILEKSLESLLDSKEIKSVNPEGNQPWIFIGRTNAEAEAPILCPPDVKADSLEKTLMLGKIEGRKRRGWQRMSLLDDITASVGREFEQTLGDNEKQRSLVCCSPWGHKESDMT